jgi:hypothetical protein
MRSGDMTITGANAPLLFARNGANRPLHQDRQVLRAGDLTLEQAAQDAMLARARRHLHGWGVVAGFIPEVTAAGLTIGPGYGVTPLGDELFLPEPADLPTVADAVVVSCGPNPFGCAVIDPEALTAARAATAELEITAWLIARPASREASPRAGVPEGCAHPGTTLLPSRRCGGVEFAILCSLPPSHQPYAPNCGALTPLVCGLTPTPLPWESVPGPEANFLVIARLTAVDQTLSATTAPRRTLWPVALIQDWIIACLCPWMSARLSPTPGAPAATNSDLAALAMTGPSGDRMALPPGEVLALRRRLDAGVIAIAGIGSARAAALAAIGVTTEGDFVTAPLDRLAAALGLPEAKVTEMKQDLNARHHLGLALE